MNEIPATPATAGRNPPRQPGEAANQPPVEPAAPDTPAPPTEE